MDECERNGRETVMRNGRRGGMGKGEKEMGRIFGRKAQRKRRHAVRR